MGDSVVNRRDKVGRPGYRQYTVSSITLDTICDRYVPNADARIVIKLDVEGAEIPALEGAQHSVKDRQLLFLYEDHRQDAASRISAYFLHRLGFDVFCWDKEYSVRRMSSHAAISSAKARSSVALNFAACAPGSVFPRLLGACGAGPDSVKKIA